MWNVIFRGEIQAQFNLTAVKKDIGLMFNLNEREVDQLFSGHKIILKKNIPLATAQHYLGIFKQKGLVVTLEGGSSIEDTVVEEPEVKLVAENQTTMLNDNSLLAKSPTLLGFDFDGRMGRLNFLNAYLVIILVVLLLSGSIAFMSDEYSIIRWVVIICLLFGYYYFSIRISVLRLHDLDNSGWLALLYLVPVINFFFVIMLMIVPGTAATNKYGAMVRRGSLLGAILYLILPVLGLIATLIYINYQDAENKKKLNNIYGELIIYQDEIELALAQNKIPILYQTTTDDSRYYPLGLAHDTSADEDDDYSTNPILTQLRSIGLELPINKEMIVEHEKGDEKDEEAEEYDDETISYYGYLSDEMGDLEGVSIVFEREDQNKWTCSIYNNDEGNLKYEYFPSDCL